MVVRRTKGGSYLIAELDGTIARTRVGASRVIPYYPRVKLKVATIEKLPDLEKIIQEEEELPMLEDLAEEDVHSNPSYFSFSRQPFKNNPISDSFSFSSLFN